MDRCLYLIRLTIIVVCFILAAQQTCAMPASPLPYDTIQPDGQPVRLHIRGDEWFNWHEDLNGYTVVRDTHGRYAYAQLGPDNRLVPTPLTVGIDDPKAAGLKKRILPPPEVIRSKRNRMYPQLADGESDPTAPQAVPPSGTVKNLVILCKFSDHTVGTHTRAAADYDILFNQIGGDATLAPTGSVKDLYLENSYGQMTLESTVVGWVTLPNTEAYYANGNDGLGNYPQNAQKMVEDALNLADPLVDFDQFDNDNDNWIDAITIIHSGYAAETGGGGGNWIWSHRWGINTWTSDEGVRVSNYHTEPALWGTSGTNIVRFGVIAHELGHFFGLPDLYDTDGGSIGQEYGNGIGSWGMMANSWGFGNNQLHPPHFCAWSKIDLGWITPTVIDTPGVYTLDQYATNPQVYRINNGYPSGEYLLIENRQPVGIESAIPQGGLCIFHIDDTASYNTQGYPGQSGWPENGKHYRVAVLQADSNYNLEKNNNRGDRYDVYHAGGVSEIGPGPGNYPNTDAYQDGIIIDTGNRIHTISAAGATMSFAFGELVDPMPPVAYDVNAWTEPNTAVTITLDAVDDGLPSPPTGLSYSVTSLPVHGWLVEPETPASPVSSVPYTLSGHQIIYIPRPGCEYPVNFTYLANDGGTLPQGGDSNTAVVSISIVPDPQVIYSADMDTDPGFTCEGQWAWGTPAGSGGSTGNPDPASGFTGSNVVGYNLAGDYTKMNAAEWATTPVIDCTDKSNVTLTFRRWLNVGSPNEGPPPRDHATIEVSNDGVSWSTVWQNTAMVTDAGWQLLEYDISAIADNQSTVYIRWGMGETNQKDHYSGWNIDDVSVTGQAQSVPVMTGDFEPDCDVDLDDLLVIMNRWLAVCGDCNGVDLIDDGIIDLLDLAVLAENWLPLADDYIMDFYWPFDIGASDIISGYDGTLMNGAAINTSDFAVGTGSLSLDGIDDYVEIPGFKGITGTQSRTCTAWIKTTQSNGGIVTWGNNDAGARWALRLQDFGGYSGRLIVSCGGGYMASRQYLADGVWHHVAAVLENDGSPNANEIKLYIDGVLETDVDSLDEPIDTHPVWDVTIGLDLSAGWYYNGLIDDVRIYNRALSQQEIDAIAQ